MKKFLALILLLSFNQMGILADTSINIGNIVKTTESKPQQYIEVKNPVVVSFDKGGDSKILKTDDVIPVTIVKSTTINGVKYRAGDKGYLNLGQVEHSRNLGKGGTIIISNGRIQDAEGKEHICRYSETISGEENNTVKILTGVGVFFTPLLASALKNGKEATIQKETIVTVSIEE